MPQKKFERTVRVIRGKSALRKGQKFVLRKKGTEPKTKLISVSRILPTKSTSKQSTIYAK